MLFASLAGAQQIPAPAGMPEQLPGTTLPPPPMPSLLAWTVDLPAGPAVSPIVTADSVIAAYLPGVIAAFSRDDGRTRWRTELAAEGPLVSDGTLVFVPSGNAVHALRVEDGTLAWRSETGALTAPMVAREGWLLAATQGRLTALRAADGTSVWSVDAGLQRERAAISGNVLFVPYADGRLIARDLTSGAVKWQRLFGGAPNEPLVFGEDIFLGVTNKSFHALNVASGEDRWRWQQRIGGTVRGRAAADLERVYFAALDNMVYALDRRSGSLRWHKGVPYRPWSGPVVAGNSVFIAGPGTELRVFGAATGTPGTPIPFPGQLALNPGFLGTNEGAVFAVVTGSLAEAWKLSMTRPIR
ncbi:MAG TPA: PQQ-binding-like beta-propeller repeat protein [Vicinamibacterales bacterium]